jgi:hypothetical protein
MHALKIIIEWSEVWALLIPLLVLVLLNKPQPGMKPVIIYILVALLLNLFGDFIADFKKLIPALPQSNNPIYNFHSLFRFTCFSFFFNQAGKRFFPRIQNSILVIYILLFLVNFIFFENFLNPLHLSGNLLSMESFLLLASCMLYYLGVLKNEVPVIAQNKDFWIVTGLSIFFVINFFVFLFYVPLLDENRKLANTMWNFHNIAYTTLCIFIAKAFYVPAGN